MFKKLTTKDINGNLSSLGTKVTAIFPFTAIFTMETIEAGHIA